MLQQGDPAPDFDLPTDEGRFKLSDKQGTPVVIYFYPKDNTPGCTTEAVDFSARLAQFKQLGIEIIGISPDSVKKHQNFRKKHDLKIALAADEDNKVAESYGVWAEKKMYGRTFMGIVRTTLLIGADGKVLEVWPKVKVKGHVEQVLEAAGQHLG